MKLSLPLDRGGVASVSAIYQEPPTPRASAFLLANGAGLPMESPFMAAVARGLVGRGFAVLRFDYPYQERARPGRPGRPDRNEVLEEAHAAALAELERRAGGRRVVLAGKSLGARISSYLAAKDHRCAALAFFGYPLHPAGKKEKLRSEHFAAIAQPALFLQGTRDALCDLDLLRPALKRFGGRTTLEIIPDADHGFHVPKRTGRTDAEVLEAMLDRVAEWERETFPD